MRKNLIFIVLLGLSFLPSVVGCGGSMEATPAENIVSERPIGFEKGKDGKMVPSTGVMQVPSK